MPAGGVGRASQKQGLDEEGDLPEEELSCEGSCRAGEEVRQVLLNPMPGPESRVWILGKAGMKVRQDTKPRSGVPASSLHPAAASLAVVRMFLL